MIARLITAAVGIPLLVGLISFAPLSVFAIVIAAFAAIGARELTAMAAVQGVAAPTWLVAVLTAAVAASPWIDRMRVDSAAGFGPTSALLLTLATLLLFCRAMFSRRPLAEVLPSLGVGLVAVMWVGLLSAHLLLLRMRGHGWVYALFLTVWGADAGAFAVGKLIGRHRLAPRLSPGKTIEGLAGGLVFAVVGALVARVMFDLDGEPAVLSMGVLAVIVAVAAVAGDLAESALKRGAGVKDSGALFPGHGGALDRLDSLLFAAPVLYHGLHLLGG